LYVNGGIAIAANVASSGEMCALPSVDRHVTSRMQALCSTLSQFSLLLFVIL